MEKKDRECRIHIRVPEGLKAEFVTACKAREATASEEVRMFMGIYVRQWRAEDEQKEPA